jgi:hypothetical protein
MLDEVRVGSLRIVPGDEGVVARKLERRQRTRRGGTRLWSTGGSQPHASLPFGLAGTLVLIAGLAFGHEARERPLAIRRWRL